MQKRSLKPFPKVWAWVPLVFNFPLKAKSERSLDGRVIGCFTLAQSPQSSGPRASFGGLARVYAPDNGSSSLAGASHWGISVGWRWQGAPWEVGSAYLKRVSGSQDLKGCPKYFHLDGVSSALCFYAQYLFSDYARCFVFGQPWSRNPRGGLEGICRFPLLPLKVAQGFLSLSADKAKDSKPTFRFKVRVKLWGWLSGELRTPLFSQKDFRFSMQAEVRDENSPLSNLLEDAAHQRHFFNSTEAQGFNLEAPCNALSDFVSPAEKPLADAQSVSPTLRVIPTLKQLQLALPWKSDEETFLSSSPSSPLNEARRSVPHTPIGHKASTPAAAILTIPPLMHRAENSTNQLSHQATSSASEGSQTAPSPIPGAETPLSVEGYSFIPSFSQGDSSQSSTQDFVVYGSNHLNRIPR